MEWLIIGFLLTLMVFQYVRHRNTEQRMQERLVDFEAYREDASQALINEMLSRIYHILATYRRMQSYGTAKREAMRECALGMAANAKRLQALAWEYEGLEPTETLPVTTSQAEYLARYLRLYVGAMTDIVAYGYARLEEAMQELEGVYDELKSMCVD